MTTQSEVSLSDMAAHLAETKLLSEEKLFKLKAQILRLHKELEESNIFNLQLKQKLVSLKEVIPNSEHTMPPTLQIEQGETVEEKSDSKEADESFVKEWVLGNEAFADGDFAACLKHHSMAAKFMIENLNAERSKYYNLDTKLTVFEDENAFLKKKIDGLNQHENSPEVAENLKQAHEQITSLDNQLEELNNLVRESSLARLDTEKMLSDLKASKNQLKASKDKVELENTSLTSKINSLTIDLNKKSDEADKACAELHLARSHAESMELKISEVGAKVASLEENNLELNKYIDEIEPLAKEFDDHQNTILALESQNEQIKQESLSKDDEIDRLNNIISSLKNENEDLRKKQDLLQNHAVETEHMHKSEIETLNQHIEELEANTISADEKIADLDARNTQLLTQINNMASEFTVLDQMIDEIASKSDLINKLSASVSRLRHENEGLKHKLQAAELTLEESEAKVDTLLVKADQLGHLRNIIDEAGSQCEQLLSLVDKLEKKDTAMNQKLRLVEDEKTTLKVAAVNARNEVISLNQSLLLKKEELQNQRAILDSASERNKIVELELVNKQESLQSVTAFIKETVTQLDAANALANKKAEELGVARIELQENIAALVQKEAYLKSQASRLSAENLSLKEEAKNAQKNEHRVMALVSDIKAKDIELSEKDMQLNLACEKMEQLNKEAKKMRVERDRAVEDASKLYCMDMPDRASVASDEISVHDLETVEGVNSLVQKLKQDIKVDITQMKDCYALVEHLLTKSDAISQRLKREDMEKKQLIRNVKDLEKDIRNRSMLDEVRSVFDPHEDVSDNEINSIYSDTTYESDWGNGTDGEYLSPKKGLLSPIPEAPLMEAEAQTEPDVGTVAAENNEELLRFLETDRKMLIEQLSVMYHLEQDKTGFMSRAKAFLAPHAFAVLLAWAASQAR